MGHNYHVMVIIIGVVLLSIPIHGSVEGEIPIEGKVPIWDRSIGSDVWSRSISDDGTYMTATNDEGTIFLFSDTNEVELWNYSVEGEDDIYAKISADGTRILAKAGSNLYFFSQDSNIPLWTLEMNDYIFSHSVSDSGSMVLITVDTNATLISGATGDILLEYDIGEEDYIRTELSGDGNYFIAGYDGEHFMASGNIMFYATNSTELLWEDSVGGGFNGLGISYDGGYIFARCGFYTTLPSYDGYTGSVYLYTHNGTQVWRKNVNAATSASMCHDGTYILAAGRDPLKIFYLTNQTDEELWTHSFTQYIGISGISNDASLILIGTDSGNLSLFNDQGAIQWERNVVRRQGGFFSDNIGDAVISGNGERIFAGTATGDLALFDNIIPPKVEAGVDFTTKEGKNVSFAGTATDPTATIVKYEWDFDGDGVYEYSSTEFGTAYHTYAKPGEYEVRYRVTNSNGAACVDTLVAKVEKKSDSPGFELSLVLLALGIVVILRSSKYKNG